MRIDPMIAVADVPASVAWYKVLLGCSNDHDRPDFDRLVHDGEVLLMLHRLQAEEHGLAKPVKGGIGSGVLLWVFVKDLDAVFAQATKLNATLVVQPHDNPQAGWREFTLLDPDGYRLAIAQPSFPSS